MNLSARADQVKADKTAQNAITALFDSIAGRLGGELIGLAGDDGLIDLAQRDAVRQRVRAIVEPEFVQRVTVSGDQLQAERDHLDHLVDLARRELRTAPTKQHDRIRARLAALAERKTALITGGVMFTALRAGRPSTAYSRIIMSGAETVSRAILERHAADMTRILAADPDLLQWLTGPVTTPARYAWMKHQPIALWEDVRGYRLSDRIWRTSEQTIARIDAILDDGIARGRSAVGMAKDLRQYLRATRRGVTTLTPYGTIGSFDARRLARSEITRAAALSSYVAGITNPFVILADYNLSGVHDPKNCDGTCDQHAAESKRLGGFAPDAVPLPMIDTHPQCMCYVTHRTGDRDSVIARLRGQYRAGLAGVQDPPITPLFTDLMVAVLMGWTADQLAA